MTEENDNGKLINIYEVSSMVGEFKVAGFNGLKITDGNVGQLERELLDEMPNCIDLEGVYFLPSRAMLTFVELEEKRQRELEKLKVEMKSNPFGYYVPVYSGRLTLIHVDPYVQRDFAITGLDKLFEIKHDLEELC